MLKVVLLDSPMMQVSGVLPFQTMHGLDSRALFFFPHIHRRTVSGVGLLEPLKVIGLDKNFQPLTKNWIGHRHVVLQPDTHYVLPEGTRHLVEIPFGGTVPPNFEFLRAYVPS